MWLSPYQASRLRTLKTGPSRKPGSPDRPAQGLTDILAAFDLVLFLSESLDIVGLKGRAVFPACAWMNRELTSRPVGTVDPYAWPSGLESERLFIEQGSVLVALRGYSGVRKWERREFARPSKAMGGIHKPSTR